MMVESGTKQHVFRANTAYELVLFDRLAETERALLGELADDASFYGVLRPTHEDGRPMRAVDRDAALLFLTLREPAPLPGYVRRAAGAHADSSVTELVMDGVLEVFDGSDYVSGARGAGLLLGAAPPTQAEGCVARLSRAALDYGAALGLHDRHELATRLYAYNRVPVSPSWARRLPDAQAVLRFLGGRRNGAAGPFVPALPKERGAWIQWARRGSTTGGRSGGRNTGHKLYVSPVPDALPDTFALFVDVLTRFPVTQFKVGADAGGVLRPDKLVAYFRDSSVLAEAGHALADRLTGLPVQGVPFTADLGGDGMLSWGIDPPPDQRPLSWMPTESWRFWVVRRLAASLIEAARGASAGALSSARFALERLRLDGVDVERWVPTASVWRRGEV